MLNKTNKESGMYSRDCVNKSVDIWLERLGHLCLSILDHGLTSINVERLVQTGKYLYRDFYKNDLISYVKLKKI